jgi:peptidoglycan/xylan/chitin deacetylase (PgdA/CDA1 family)
MNYASLGVCRLPAPPQNAPRTVRYGNYIHEILCHAGLCYETLTLRDLGAALEAGSGMKLLLTVGEWPFPADLKAQLEVWVRGGGAWLSIGGLCGMEELLGASSLPPNFVLWGGNLRSLGEGYLDARGSDHPILADLPIPLHYFGGVSVQPTEATIVASCLDVHGRSTELPALLENTVEAGRCLLLTPDLTGTIVRIQQGVAITRDGVPAPDGTAPVNDGVLKSDDGQVLDWLLDREEVPGVPGLYAFLQPIADQWRGVLLRALFYLAEKTQAVLPLLWYYPDNRPALGHLSHDTDGNVPELGQKLLETLQQADARSTWCVILPGYPPELMAAIKAAGHELATHFDAMSAGCPWGEAHFDRQWQELRALFGTDPVTNKNHYLRWEGDTEFFDWCIARNITLDQSKGASKTGEAGFNFGSCHPYRPVAPDGKHLPILELATPTQDLLIFAPEGLLLPLLDAVLRQYGILHLLFHPAHIAKPGVADSLLRAVGQGRERGLDWWTAAAISTWENARRAAHWQAEESTDPTRAAFTLTAAPDAPLPGATILILAPERSHLTAPSLPSFLFPLPCIERWGFRFQTITCNIAAGETLRLEVPTP